MTVDGSYTAWARPTRRVHLALSLGMTLTGVILIAAGASGTRGAVRPSPLIGQTADSVVNGDAGAAGSQIPAAPLVHFAPPAPATPHPGAKAHAKPRPHPRQAVSTPTQTQTLTQTSEPTSEAVSAPVAVRVPVPAPTAEQASEPARRARRPADVSRRPAPSPASLPVHPPKH